MGKENATASDPIDIKQANKLKNTGNHLNKETTQDNEMKDQQTSESIDDGKDLDRKENFLNSIANESNISKDVHDNQEKIVIDKDNEDDKQDENVSLETEHNNFKDDVEISSSMRICDENNKNKNTNGDINTVDIDSTGSAAFIQHKLQNLYSRELRPCNSKLVHQSFDENVPDFFQRHIVTVKAPEEQLIPRNVFLNNTAYVLNLENLRLKKVIPVASSSSENYSSLDDVNGRHVKRIRSSLSNESAQNNLSTQFFPRFPQQANHFRQFNYWNNYNLNFAFQRQFFQSFPLRFQAFPRMQQFFRCFPTPVFMPNVGNPEIGRPRKRKGDNTRVHHLKSIKGLALKLKSLVNMGNTQVENIQALHRLIQTYNQRYKAKLELTEELDVLENEVILETINLDDDDQISPKKKRKCDEDGSFDENFSALKQFALKIKELEEKKESSPQHRRALSKAIKTFNKSYNADIYVDMNYEVINRRHIVIASSDSEGAVEVAPKPRKSRKLRNPFYILKQLSEKQNASTTQQEVVKSGCSHSDATTKKHFKYSEVLTSNVSKYWLPSENDFGRAEVIQKNQTYNHYLNHSEQFLYEFMKGHLYDNWLDAKISYWQSCEKSAKKFEANSQNQSTLNFNSIVRPEDCTDLQSVLKKLNIIRNNKDVKEECSFGIDFDVYNRDVPNFKKTNMPKPHFRVICIEESSKFPTALDFATHHHKYTDDVNIVFAILRNDFARQTIEHWLARQSRTMDTVPPRAAARTKHRFAAVDQCSRGGRAKSTRSDYSVFMDGPNVQQSTNCSFQSHFQNQPV
ncbi:hypothetical protein MSG28_004259 [Choristoneura fumiferana]|uniref:Uncharacterized protein n=1 Tax=Choristoneura fumiferana TaxID=7141 RepID=A0ACC0KIQ8_CHOFU|nr:hypothetical protein MSG28_004259 [Choristoneura fumiferana]